MKVIAIIPAAGLGTRMASATAIAQGRTRSKQFAQLEGVPILIHTLRKFAELPEISEIWIPMRKSESELFRQEVRKHELVARCRSSRAVSIASSRWPTR